MDRVDVAVVGAGPFGLSTAAWLHDRPVRVFGTPMRTWRTLMPPDMLLRSAWEETSLSAPSDGTIDDWVAAVGERRTDPLPLGTFLRYAGWFCEHFVRDLETHDVVEVKPFEDGYLVRTAGGGETQARTIILAVGVTPFPQTPPAFEGLVGGSITFAIEQTRYEHLCGRRVAVVGGGQSALESAGLAGSGGAAVEVISRSRVRWFADREPYRSRTPIRRRLYRLAYPAVGYGPPPFNRLVLHPDLFAALPQSIRSRLTRRLLRPGGSPWLRRLVQQHARVTEGISVVQVEREADALSLGLSDGSRREVDAVILATGYRFSLERLGFVDEELRSRIAVVHGWPVLDRWFRSTDPNVFFVGYAAEGRFGPLSRFVLGTDFTARRVAAALRLPGSA